MNLNYKNIYYNNSLYNNITLKVKSYWYFIFFYLFSINQRHSSNNIKFSFLLLIKNLNWILTFKFNFRTSIIFLKKEGIFLSIKFKYLKDNFQLQSFQLFSMKKKLIKKKKNFDPSGIRTRVFYLTRRVCLMFARISGKRDFIIV